MEPESLFRRALDTSERILGPGHRTTLNILGDSGNLPVAAGRLDEAMIMVRETLPRQQEGMQLAWNDHL